ncbi:pyridoxine 5'-phosphate synthase [Congregibacter variabilis]|uniref:Pyridoxine 5'-phosphate synthase n=1 Tax=Congregibacter variabilis TaxID=3081200 RepID=A0ABZ0I6K8_9GAMM|nr:pyridoxine 5'-phosphate synthase [Congregibacter sp. IMCC43200]
MIALSVNLNKIALIRNSRDTVIPSVTEHAQMCIDAGANGITVHPRPDQRHIRADDCRDLAPMLNVEFNIEGNPFAGPRASDRKGVSDYPGFMELVRELRPTQCTLVPDGDTQLTSDHGFDLHRQAEELRPILAELRDLGIRSSLFMDPVPEQMSLAAEIGADRIELYTESFAVAVASDHEIAQTYQRFKDTAEAAIQAGLGVNAGHDLNLHNLPYFRELPGLMEVSIGHALTIDALRMGMPAAVAAYLAALAGR